MDRRTYELHFYLSLLGIEKGVGWRSREQLRQPKVRLPEISQVERPSIEVMCAISRNHLHRPTGDHRRCTLNKIMTGQFSRHVMIAILLSFRPRTDERVIRAKCRFYYFPSRRLHCENDRAKKVRLRQPLCTTGAVLNVRLMPNQGCLCKE